MRSVFDKRIILLLLNILVAIFIIFKWTSHRPVQVVKAEIRLSAEPLTSLNQAPRIRHTVRTTFPTVDFPESAELAHRNYGPVGFLENFFVSLTTSFVCEVSGRYEFTLYSDDGARLVLDGETLIDMPQAQAWSRKSTLVELSQGSHEIEILYFQSQGPAGVVATYRPQQQTKPLPLGVSSQQLRFN